MTQGLLHMCNKMSDRPCLIAHVQATYIVHAHLVMVYVHATINHSQVLRETKKYTCP